MASTLALKGLFCLSVFKKKKKSTWKLWRRVSALVAVPCRRGRRGRRPSLQSHCGSQRSEALNYLQRPLCSTETRVHRWRHSTLSSSAVWKGNESSEEVLDGFMGVVILFGLGSFGVFLHRGAQCLQQRFIKREQKKKKQKKKASPLKLYSSITRCFTSWTLSCCTYFCRRIDSSSVMTVHL